MWNIVKNFTYIISLNPQKSSEEVGTINIPILHMNILTLKKLSYLLKFTYLLYPSYS